MLSRRSFNVSSWGALFVLLTIVLLILPRDAFGFITPRASRTVLFHSNQKTTTSNDNNVIISSTTTTTDGLMKTILYDNKSNNDDFDDDDPVREARRLLDRARQIRESLATIDDNDSTNKGTTPSLSTVANRSSSPFTIPPTNDDNNNDNSSSVGYYRLYVDIGREKGTWMEPRWGASGNRIEFSIDVRFSPTCATEEIATGMVKDNFGGKSSEVYVVKTAPYARLRGGFDRMKCDAGGYRFDVDRKKTTVRFYVGVEGTSTNVAESTYGDVSVPKGGLYFSIPCFGQAGAAGGVVSNLSTKEYPVTVRMMGWNTGWRRMESRMVGVYRAVPIEQARMRDHF